MNLLSLFARYRSLINSAFLLSIGSVVFIPSSIEARLGEQAADIEKRILTPGHGREFPPERAAAKRTQVPIHGLISNYQTANNNSLTPQVIWKSVDGRRIPSNGLRDGMEPEGWNLFIYYKNGRSVLEVYRRVGAGLTQYEINGLLSLHKGDSVWERPSEKEPSAIGYDFQRADGLFRARQMGSSFILFYKALDDEMVKIQEVSRKKQEEEQAKNVTNSLLGF
jgi:hypothetical protein